MRRLMMWTVAVGVLAGTPASAQDKRIELSATAGWTFSDGVGGATTVIVPGQGTFNAIGPKDAFSWSGRLGYMVNDNLEIGALYGQQSTVLELGGSSTPEIGDMSVRNYHGYFAYNAGDLDSAVRPYFLGGLGATQIGSVAASLGTRQRDIGGSTKFSTTWAAGLKLFPSKSFGIRLEGRWTPTYIKSDAVGYWCDPYWGCYTVGDAQYMNQFELGGGITLRF